MCHKEKSSSRPGVFGPLSVPSSLSQGSTPFLQPSAWMSTPTTRLGTKALTLLGNVSIGGQDAGGGWASCGHPRCSLRYVFSAHSILFLPTQLMSLVCFVFYLIMPGGVGRASRIPQVVLFVSLVIGPTLIELKGVKISFKKFC